MLLNYKIYITTMEEGQSKKKVYSGTKIPVHEEFLKDIRSHNRKLVDEKNKLVDQLAKAEDKILSQHQEIESYREQVFNFEKQLQESNKLIQEQQKDILKLKEAIEEIKTRQPSQPRQPIVEERTYAPQQPQNPPIQQPISYANNFQENRFSKKQYTQNYQTFTKAELFTIRILGHEPQTYQQLRQTTGADLSRIRNWISRLNQKIPIQKRKNVLGDDTFWIEKDLLIGLGLRIEDTM